MVDTGYSGSTPFELEEDCPYGNQYLVGLCHPPVIFGFSAKAIEKVLGMSNGEAILAAFLAVEVCSELSREAGETGPMLIQCF